MAFYDNITLEKGLYQPNGEGFTKALETLDPSTNYKGTELEGLDAYERQLKRFDIKIKGYNSDSVEKFFQNSQTATLFPEFVKRSVAQGLAANSVLDDIIATTTKITSRDYRPITTIAANNNHSLVEVAETAQIPQTEIKSQANLINLKKRGRLLVSSYEAIRFERIDLFAVTLRQIGAYIGKAQLNDALDTIINGDGNSNASSVIQTASTTLTYDDLINLWSQFNDFEMNRLIVSPDVMKKLVAISELKNPETGLNFQETGKLSTPLGATLYRANGLANGKLIGLDKNCALEKVTCGDIAIEYDKLIDRQLERAAITSTTGFAKIFKDASVVMNIKA